MKILENIVEWFKCENKVRELTDRKNNLLMRLSVCENEYNKFIKALNQYDLEKSRFILTKSLTAKETEDLQTLTKMTQYPSLRSYLMKTAAEVYERASVESEENSKMLCLFAKYIKSLVVELDAMKVIPEPVSEDSYDA